MSGGLGFAPLFYHVELVLKQIVSIFEEVQNILLFYTHSEYFLNIKELFLLLPFWSWVYQNGSTEQLLTHSSVPKEHPIGCFFSALSSQLAHVTVEELKYSTLLFS